MGKYSLAVVAWVTVSLVLLGGCSPDAVEENQVRNQQDIYVKAQPPPMFDWSLERQMMIQLYTARNNAVGTFSLTWDAFRGKISWSCPSIGFPIPGGTQLTNSERYVANGATLPQPEPNGMFSPATSAGTYVMCANEDGTVSPTYVEDNVRTFTQPMIEVDGLLVPAPDSTPSLKIDTTRPAN